MNRFDNRIAGIPPIGELKEICMTEDVAFQYLNARGVFEHNLGQCQHCHAGTMVDFLRDDAKYQLRCNNRQCRKSHSMFRGTFFTKSKLPLNIILLLGYLWLVKLNWTQISMITRLSENAVTNFIGFFRQLVTLDAKDTQIGGPGIVVEIDETKFGKRKYNKGHRVEGFWVFGGVERTAERKFFVVREPDRSRITFEQLISKITYDITT